MPDVLISVNGRTTVASEGSTVAAVLLSVDQTRFRTDLHGRSRAPLCGMGVCFECRVTIDGVPHQRSCQIAVRRGMEIETT